MLAYLDRKHEHMCVYSTTPLAYGMPLARYDRMGAVHVTTRNRMVVDDTWE